MRSGRSSGGSSANPAAAAAWGSARHFGALDFVQHSLPALDPWHLTYQNHLPLSALYRREAVLSAVGWQLDGLGHIGVDNVYYNCNKAADFAAADGLKKLGIEKVPAFVTRGVVLI